MTHYKGEIGVPMHNISIYRDEKAEGRVKGQGLLRRAGEIERQTGIPCEGRSKAYLQWYIKKYG